MRDSEYLPARALDVPTNTMTDGGWRMAGDGCARERQLCKTINKADEKTDCELRIGQ